MKTKYIVMYVERGVTKERRFTVNQKEDAIKIYKEKKTTATRIKIFSIDSDDEEIWYDLSKNY